MQIRLNLVTEGFIRRTNTPTRTLVFENIAMDLSTAQDLWDQFRTLASTSLERESAVSPPPSDLRHNVSGNRLSPEMLCLKDQERFRQRLVTLDCSMILQWRSYLRNGVARATNL